VRVVLLFGSIEDRAKNQYALRWPCGQAGRGRNSGRRQQLAVRHWERGGLAAPDATVREVTRLVDPTIEVAKLLTAHPRPINTGADVIVFAGCIADPEDCALIDR